MRRGFAPTSRDFAHRAAANGFDPTMRWICNVESIAVRSDTGVMFQVGAVGEYCVVISFRD